MKKRILLGAMGALAILAVLALGYSPLLGGALAAGAAFYAWAAGL